MAYPTDRQPVSRTFRSRRRSGVPSGTFAMFEQIYTNDNFVKLYLSRPGRFHGLNSWLVLRLLTPSPCRIRVLAARFAPLNSPARQGASEVHSPFRRAGMKRVQRSRIPKERASRIFFILMLAFQSKIVLMYLQMFMSKHSSKIQRKTKQPL